MTETRRRILFLAGLVALVLVVAFLTGTGRSGGPPLDPRSTAPDGTAGLVRTLEGLGSDVVVEDRSGPSPQTDAVLVLQDRLTESEAADLDALASDGATVVVADPSSLLAPPSMDTGVGFELDEAEELRSERCEIPALTDVGPLSLPPVARYETGRVRACYVEPSGAYVTETRQGAGAVRAVGGAVLFTNRWLDQADNAVLAARLLEAGPGADIFVYDPNRIAGPGAQESLVDLIETPVRAFLFQLAVAFGLVALWRARRLGHPVYEPQPVTIDGAELTAAVGRLLASNRRPDRAAADLRDRFRTELAGRLGLPADASDDQLASVLAARSLSDPATVARALSAPVRDDAELVEVATRLERLRQEVIHGPHRH